MSIHYEDGYRDACPNCGEEDELYTENIEKEYGLDSMIIQIERYCQHCGGTFTEVYQFVHTYFDEESI